MLYKANDGVRVISGVLAPSCVVLVAVVVMVKAVVLRLHDFDIVKCIELLRAHGMPSPAHIDLCR